MTGRMSVVGSIIKINIATLIVSGTIDVPTVVGGTTAFTIAGNVKRKGSLLEVVVIQKILVIVTVGVVTRNDPFDCSFELQFASIFDFWSHNGGSRSNYTYCG